MKKVENSKQITCDDCVVLVAVPSVGAGITFARIVRAFQLVVAVVEDIPDFVANYTFTWV